MGVVSTTMSHRALCLQRQRRRAAAAVTVRVLLLLLLLLSATTRVTGGSPAHTGSPAADL